MKTLTTIITILAMLILFKNLPAQVSAYNFNQTSSTYTEISGGVIIASATGTSGTASLDDVNYPSQTLPFSFIFNNVSYNSYNINSNGNITFGSTLPPGGNYFPISAANSYSGAVSALGLDLQGVIGFTANRTSGSNVLTNVSSFLGIETGKLITGTGIPSSTTITGIDQVNQQIIISNNSSSTGSNTFLLAATGSISSVTTGSPGSRVHIIQWKNFKRFGSGYVNDCINFQIKLHESTSTITMSYGQNGFGSTPAQSQVGLRGATNSDFKNRKTVSPSPNWSATIQGSLNSDSCRLSGTCFPLNGLTFEFAPTVLQHDVSCTGVISPPDIVPLNGNFTPTVSVRNFGANTESFNVTVVIKNFYNGVTMYNATNSVYNLGSGMSTNVSFNSSMLPGDAYTMSAFTELPGDQFLQNDTSEKTFEVMDYNMGFKDGYNFANSMADYAPSYPLFNWIDTTGSIDLIRNKVVIDTPKFKGTIDDGLFKYAYDGLDRRIRVFGSEADSFFIGTNGIIGFDFFEPGSGNWIPPVNGLPGGNIKNAVFPFWTDLSFGSNSATVNRLSYKFLGDWLVITYDRAPLYNGSSTEYVSFQVAIELVPLSLTSNSRVLVLFNTSNGNTGAGFINRYLTNTLPANLIGLQNITATQSLTYRLDHTSGLEIARPLFGQGNSGLALALGPDPMLLNINVNSDNPIVYFYQNDFDCGTTFHNNSDWGTLEVVLPYFTGLKYLNLSVNIPGITTQWQIRNAILQNHVSQGNTQHQFISFDIGNDGVNVSNIQYGIEITSMPLMSMPPISLYGPVSDYRIKVRNGDNKKNSTIEFAPDQAVPFEVNVDPNNIDTARHEDFPNQPCPYENYCTPTAISNSLLFLNDKHGLGMDSNKLKISHVAAGIGTDENGTPIDWVPLKKEYMEDNKLPITSRELPPGDIEDIIKEIKNGQDVEIRIYKAKPNGDTVSHCVAATGMVDTKNGKYEVSTNDDKNQDGTSGGLRTNEKSTYDTTSKKFTGGIFKGWEIRSFVVECPNKLSTTPQTPSNNSGGVERGDPLTWSPTPGASSYWLELAGDTAFANKIVDERNVQGVSYIPSEYALAPLTDYYWRVRVNDSVGPGVPSVAYHFTTANFALTGPVYTFYQNDYNLGDTIIKDSDWGTLEVTMPYFTGLRYLNLYTNMPGTTSSWQIKNAVIQNQTTPGNTQKHSVTFDIGIRGVDVSNISFAVDLSMMPRLTFLNPNAVAPVLKRDVGLRGSINMTVEYSYPLPYARPFECPVDPTLLDTAKHVNFPNQECPYPKYCTPTAVSNSLQFLNTKHNLEMNAGKISIDSVVKALGTDTTNGSPDNWPSKKKKYMEDNKLPITTREIDPKNIRSIIAEIANGQDVEIDMRNDSINSNNDTGYHTACVTGLIDLHNGEIQMTTSDDTEQGKAGGLSTDAESIYDTTQKKFTSGELTDWKIVRFIVECPNKLKTSPSSPSNFSNGISPLTPLTCNPVPGASSYWFEVSTSSTFSLKQIDERNVMSNTYTPLMNQLQPGTTYFWRVRVNDSVGPGTVDTFYQFTTGTPKTMNLGALIQGLYNPATNTMIPDTTVVYVRNSNSPYNIVDSAKARLGTTGTGAFSLYNVSNGTGYYIDLRHRNSIQTWSSLTPQFITGTLNYDFRLIQSRAYGSNQIQIDNSPVLFAIYNGDINQDGAIDLTDIVRVFNDANNFVTGYAATDVNGDNFVDLSDLTQTYNNSNSFVSVIRP